MATYEYVCLHCERPFEERRSMMATVDTAVACPSCGSGRTRRRFSLFATSTGGSQGGTDGRSGGTCACGGACACGAH